MLHCLNLLPSPREPEFLCSKVSTGGNLRCTEQRWGFPVVAIIRRTVGALLADRSARAPVGIELAWKEQGHNKAPQEAMQSRHIFHCFCSPACN